MVSSPRLNHHRIGRGGEVTHTAVVVHGVDRHLPSFSEDAAELAQDAMAVRVVVVAERIQPAHHGVERPVDREGADVPSR